MQLNDLLPYAAIAGGLLLGYHILMSNKEAPSLAAPGNTIDHPDFPRVGIDYPHVQFDSQDVFPHPYAHPKIPRYVGAPAYFQNSIPMDESFYTNDVWYDKQIPPIHIKVSANHPTPETYSHHHMYFEKPGPELSPIDVGVFTNTV